MRVGGFCEVGGGGEIRTLEGLSSSPVFKTGAFNRSATPPQRGPILLVFRFQSTSECPEIAPALERIAFKGSHGMIAPAGCLNC